jgi:hypothetical protein
MRALDENVADAVAFLARCAPGTGTPGDIP